MTIRSLLQIYDEKRYAPTEAGREDLDRSIDLFFTKARDMT